MHPIAFELWGWPVHSYGLLAALGFLAALATWRWLDSRGSGMPQDFGSELGTWLLVGGILGARAAYVIANWESYAANPLEILRIDHGGLIYYGGFAGGALALLAVAWARRIPAGRLADYAICGLAAAHVCGRVGCFLQGCCFGKPVPAGWEGWGVRYPFGSEAWEATRGAAVWPVQLWEAAGVLAILGVLVWAAGRWREGWRVAGLYLLAYPALRFALEFFRGDLRQGGWGLDAAQWISLALFACGAGLMLWGGRRRRA